MPCAPQEWGKGRDKFYIAHDSTADNIQPYRHSESGADSSGTDSSGINTAIARERTITSKSSSIYSSAQAQGQRSSDKKAAICIHNILAGLPAADTPPPTPGFGGGMKMKLCQRVEVILFRPFSQPSSKNFGLNEVSLFHELF